MGLPPHLQSVHKNVYGCDNGECRVIMFVEPTDICPACKNIGLHIRGPIPEHPHKATERWRAEKAREEREAL